MNVNRFASRIFTKEKSKGLQDSTCCVPIGKPLSMVLATPLPDGNAVEGVPRSFTSSDSWRKRRTYPQMCQKVALNLSDIS